MPILLHGEARERPRRPGAHALSRLRLSRPSPPVLAGAAAVASGLAAFASQPPVGWWPLAFLALPLLLVAVGVEDHAATVAGTRARVLRWGLLAGLARFLPMLVWLVAPAGYVAWILLSLLQSLFFAFLAVLVRPWVRSRWIVLIAPLAWTGMEAWRAVFPIGGFGWGALAYAHVDGSWMLPIARLLGEHALTLTTTVIGVFLFEAGRRMHAATEGLAGSVRDHLRAGLPHAQPAFLGLAAALVVSVLAIVEPPPTTGETLDVLAVQGNDIEDRSVVGAGEDEQIAANLLAETRASVAAQGSPDLTVWPEAAIDRDPYTARGAFLRPYVDEAAALVDGNLLFGASLDGPTADTWRVASVLAGPDGLPTGRYVKRHVVPFGEYIPARDLLDWFPPLDQIPRDAVPGVGPQTLTTSSGVRLAVAICFETLFGDVVRDNLRADGDPAGLIVASTTDASYGRSAEPEQHLAQSRLRAVETGRWVVHAALSGASAFVDPDGQVHDRTELFTVDGIRRSVPLVQGSTPFLAVGDVVGTGTRLAVVALAAGLGVLVLRRRRRDANLPVSVPSRAKDAV